MVMCDLMQNLSNKLDKRVSLNVIYNQQSLAHKKSPPDVRLRRALRKYRVPRRVITVLNGSGCSTRDRVPITPAVY